MPYDHFPHKTRYVYPAGVCWNFVADQALHAAGVQGSERSTQGELPAQAHSSGAGDVATPLQPFAPVPATPAVEPADSTYNNAVDAVADGTAVCTPADADRMLTRKSLGTVMNDTEAISTAGEGSCSAQGTGAELGSSDGGTATSAPPCHQPTASQVSGDTCAAAHAAQSSGAPRSPAAARGAASACAPNTPAAAAPQRRGDQHTCGTSNMAEAAEAQALLRQEVEGYLSDWPEVRQCVVGRPEGWGQFLNGLLGCVQEVHNSVTAQLRSEMELAHKREQSAQRRLEDCQMLLLEFTRQME